MVRYHEAGRFCEKDEEWDQESAVFHLEHAADLGELEAIVGLGLMYSQLPHHILADVSLKVSGWGLSQPITLPSLGLCPGNFLSITLGPGTSKLTDTNRIGLWPWGLSKDDSHVPRQLQQGAMGEAEDAAANK